METTEYGPADPAYLAVGQHTKLHWTHRQAEAPHERAHQTEGVPRSHSAYKTVL